MLPPPADNAKGGRKFFLMAARMEASKRARAGVWWCAWSRVRTEGVQFGGQGAVEGVAIATGLAMVGVVAFAGMAQQKKRSVYNFIQLFLFTYRSYTRFPRIQVCIPEFSILVFLLTFTYHMYTRTAIYQPHTRIYYIYHLYTDL